MSWERVEVLFLPPYSGPDHRFGRTTVELDDSVIDALIKLVQRPIRDRGERPAMLLVGWRTYYQIALWFSRLTKAGELCKPDEFYDVPLKMLPSRESYALVVERKERMNRCPLLEWAP